MARISLAVAVMTMSTLGQLNAKGNAKSTPPEIVAADVGAIRAVIAEPGARAVLLNVWASWCEPCREEMPDIIRAYQKYKSRGLRVVLVSADFAEDRDAAARFLASVGVDFRSYQKTGDDMAFINGIDSRWTGALPASFLYDSRRKLHHFWREKVSARDLHEKLEQVLKKGD